MRLLVVEDEVPLAEAIAAGLRTEGFEVDIAHDGTDGYARGGDAVYGAIVLDIMLPGLNGYRVCRGLRADGVTTPILMLTAKDGEYDEAEGLDTGADDFLRKPFSFVVLVARVRALLRRAGRGEEVVTAGRLSLDRARRTASLDEHEVELTEREADVLALLMASPGEPVAKTTILSEVWRAGPDRDPNIVEVYVGYLRRKLGDAAVETVRGHGYRVAGA